MSERGLILRLNGNRLKALDTLVPELLLNNADVSKSTQTLWFLAGPLLNGHPLQYVPVACSPFQVGRHASANLCLQDLTVSSRHAELQTDGQQLLVADLRSTNGTYVNGQRIGGVVEAHTEDLIQFADMPFRLMKQSAATNSNTISHDAIDQALALVQFESLMSQEAVIPHYQPIVDLKSGAGIGYEVLGRSSIPGLESPKVMFSAAGQLRLEFQLSNMLRIKGVEQSRCCAALPHLFLNTHPAELHHPDFVASLQDLRRVAGEQRLTLEIHEAAVAKLDEMKHWRDALAALDVDLAFDDFGSGQARLLELLELRPRYVKFDRCLLCGLDEASRTHRQMVSALVAMVLEIDVCPLAEGIETAGEAQACRDLGFVLAQGFYFGRPARMKTI